MKINKPEISILTVETSTLFFKLFGFIFLVSGVVLLYFMTDTYTLKCENRKSQCVLTHHQLFVNKKKPIASINRAKIFYSRSKEGNRVYYLKLKTSEGNIPLNQIASPFRKSLRKNALTINRYIRAPRDSAITIENLYPWWFFLLPILFIITSTVMILLPKTTLVTCDKSANALMIRRKNIFSKIEKKYSLSSVKKVILEETAGNNSRLYRIAFVLNDDSIIPLTKTYDNFLPSKIKSIDAICEFLNLAKDHSLSDKIKDKKKLGFIIFIIALSFILEGVYLIHSGTFS